MKPRDNEKKSKQKRSKTCRENQHNRRRELQRRQEHGTDREDLMMAIAVAVTMTNARCPSHRAGSSRTGRGWTRSSTRGDTSGDRRRRGDAGVGRYTATHGARHGGDVRARRGGWATARSTCCWTRTSGSPSTAPPPSNRAASPAAYCIGYPIEGRPGLSCSVHECGPGARRHVTATLKSPVEAGTCRRRHVGSVIKER